jgi:hypothetical protein
MEIPAELKSPEGMRIVANYLRSQNGIKVRAGIEHEKRVDYFKGSRLVEALMEPKTKWSKVCPG